MSSLARLLRGLRSRLSLPRLSGASGGVPLRAFVLGICTRGAATPRRARGRLVGGPQSSAAVIPGAERASIPFPMAVGESAYLGGLRGPART